MVLNNLHRKLKFSKVYADISLLNIPYKTILAKMQEGDKTSREGGSKLNVTTS